MGPSTAALVRAARERDIPWLRLNEFGLVQLGHGRYQQRIQATVTSQTRQIAVEIGDHHDHASDDIDDTGWGVITGCGWWLW